MIAIHWGDLASCIESAIRACGYDPEVAGMQKDFDEFLEHHGLDVLTETHLWVLLFAVHMHFEHVYQAVEGEEALFVMKQLVFESMFHHLPGDIQQFAYREVDDDMRYANTNWDMLLPYFIHAEERASKTPTIQSIRIERAGAFDDLIEDYEWTPELAFINGVGTVWALLAISVMESDRINAASEWTATIQLLTLVELLPPRVREWLKG